MTAARVSPAWGRQQGDFDDGWMSLGPVGTYRANAFGLYDMHGSVWEWCLEQLGGYSGPAHPGDGRRVRGDGSGSRVARGGSFSLPAVYVRSSYRGRYAPSIRDNFLGLRAARTLRSRD